MKQQDSTLLPGTTIAFSGQGVLLRGPTRSGKSDLALRCMAMGATLVSDSQVRAKNLQKSIGLQDAGVMPGVLEIYGVGIIKVKTEASAILALVVDLVPHDDVPRLPKWENIDILKHPVPRLRLHAFDAATPQKILTALEIVNQPDLLLD